MLMNRTGVLLCQHDKQYWYTTIAVIDIQWRGFLNRDGICSTVNGYLTSNSEIYISCFHNDLMS
jgi:hypothetical protein